MAAGDPWSIEAWTELALDWQHALGAWSAWWLGITEGVPAGRSARAQPSMAPAGPFDPAAVTRLHERYAERFAALWQRAVGEQPAAPRVTEDRRFASPAWREQPFFAWVRDAYLLYSEYLAELASLAQLPPEEKRRLEFSTRQFADAVAPSNFPATNPDVIARALATEGASL